MGEIRFDEAAGFGAAIVPLVGLAAVCLLADESLPRVVQVGGMGSWFVLGSAVPALAALMRGARHHDPLRGNLLVVASGLTPVIVGLAGHAWGMTRVVHALEYVEPFLASDLAARGFAETLRPIELGFGLGAGFLAYGAAQSLVVGRTTATRLGLLASSLLAFAAAYLNLRYSHAVETDAVVEEATRALVNARIASTMIEQHFVLVASSAGALLLVGSFAIIRTEGDPIDLAGLVAASFVILGIGGTELAIRLSTSCLAAQTHTSYLAHLDAFAALEIASTASSARELVVTPEALVVDRRRVPLAASELDAAFRTEGRDPTFVGPRKRLALALDARIAPSNLARVVASVRSAGFDDLEIRGVAPLPDGANSMRSASRDPYARLLLPRRTATVVELTPRDPIIPTRARVTIDGTTDESRSPATSGSTPSSGTVELLLGPTATPSALARHAERTRASGAIPRLVTRFSTDEAEPDSAPSPTGVAAAFAALRPGVRRCYEEALRLDPALAGRATVDVTIGPGGVVTAADVALDGLVDSVGACIERAVRQGHFPDPGPTAPMRVHFPFDFEANR